MADVRPVRIGDERFTGAETITVRSPYDGAELAQVPKCGPEEVDRAVAAHLELCDPCVVYLEQVRSTAASLRELPSPTLPPAARDRLLDVFTALHGHDGQA